MNMPASSRPRWTAILIFMQIFLGINGLFGGLALIVGPDGSLLHTPLSQLRNAPLSSFFIPGILLLLFLGVYPLAVAYSPWKRPTGAGRIAGRPSRVRTVSGC